MVQRPTVGKCQPVEERKKVGRIKEKGRYLGADAEDSTPRNRNKRRTQEDWSDRSGGVHPMVELVSPDHGEEKGRADQVRSPESSVVPVKKQGGKVIREVYGSVAKV